MTHQEYFNRFQAQPIGRAKLYLVDYATNAETMAAVQALFQVALPLKVRTIAAMTESTQPNTSDFLYTLKTATK